MSNPMQPSAEPPITLGVVSFLNSRPLVEGLDSESGVSLSYAVPSALPGMLRSGEVDTALIPVIDLARQAGAWRRVSDACIGSDGPTMTVRVFSRVSPDRMSTLYVDGDSHTSVVLARLIWSRYFERRLQVMPLEAARDPNACESVLLIGDKVVTGPVEGFEHQIDLGGAWKEWTGLPFVFAVWAAPTGADHARLGRILNAARDRGVARAAEIATEAGPARGWPVDVAREYLTERLMFKVSPAAEEAIELYLDLARQEGILPPVPQLTQ